MAKGFIHKCKFLDEEKPILEGKLIIFSDKEIPE